VSESLDIILITRRMWKMGGARTIVRGIDELGNAANCSESETLVVRKN
jgi:hypothetical protein